MIGSAAAEGSFTPFLFILNTIILYKQLAVKKTDLQIRISQWIELSLSDLLSSRILFLAGQHRNSYFLLQQSVEKANKAFALYIGFTEEEFAKDIRHDQMKIFKKEIKKKEVEIQELLSMLERFPNAKNSALLKPFNFHEYHKSLLSSIGTIDNLRNVDLVSISASEINYLIDGIYEIEDDEIQLPKFNDPTIKELFKNVSDLLGQIEIKPGETTKGEWDFVINDEQNIRLLTKIYTEELKIVNRVAFIEYAFIICAFFTIQHSSLTRYFVGDKNPLKIYTKKLPLVKKQQEIMDVFERAVLEFKKMLNSKPLKI